MPGGFVNNLQPGNFSADGVYVYRAPAQAVSPVGPASGYLGIDGTAQWGLFNTPTPFTNLATAYALFGTNTTLNASLVRDAVAASAGGSQLMMGVRVGDGTQAACTIVILDASSGVVGTLTAQQYGTLPLGLNASGVSVNPSQAALTFQTGTVSAGPQLNMQITFPNASVESYTVPAYQTASGPYAPATFKANMATAVNTGTSTQAPSPRWTWTSGGSTNPPNTAVVFTASGGSDGATGVTSTVQIGADGTVNRTGIYAFRGAIQGGQFVCAGMTDTTKAQTLVLFNRQEGTRAGISFPLGTQTTTALTIKQTNSASDPTLDTCIDWVSIVDPFTGVLTYMNPAAAVEGIISSLQYFQDPSNKPYGGMAGIVATEKSIQGAISQAEMSTRQLGGLMYVTNPINRGAVWGLPHGMASDGVSNIADVRAANFFGLSLIQVLGPFVGELQSQAVNDPTRVAAKGAVNAFMQSQLVPVQKISGYNNVLDLSNNTPTSISQGFLIDNIAIQTLAGTKFILVNEQVGTNVQVTVQSANYNQNQG